jgi:hypothetical protein
MKRILPLSLAVLTFNAFAADFGLGVSVESNDAWIYVPIDVSPKLRIEPNVRYIESESEVQSKSDIFGSIFTTSESQSLEIGIAVFGLTSVLEAVRAYYGARVAYIDSEFEIRSSGDFTEISQEQSADGYRISPTIGFEYQFNRRFSIGGEAAWFYQDIDIDNDAGTATGRADIEQNGTETNLIFRFFF